MAQLRSDATEFCQSLASCNRFATQERGHGIQSAAPQNPDVAAKIASQEQREVLNTRVSVAVRVSNSNHAMLALNLKPPSSTRVLYVPASGKHIFRG